MAPKVGSKMSNQKQEIGTVGFVLLWFGLSVSHSAILMVTFIVSDLAPLQTSYGGWGVMGLLALVLVLANFALWALMVANGSAGQRYKLNFPKVAGTTFGHRGVYLVTLVRGTVAILWFAIQNLICTYAAIAIVGLVFPGLGASTTSTFWLTLGCIVITLINILVLCFRLQGLKLLSWLAVGAVFLLVGLLIFQLDEVESSPAKLIENIRTSVARDSIGVTLSSEPQEEVVVIFKNLGLESDPAADSRFAFSKENWNAPQALKIPEKSLEDSSKDSKETGNQDAEVEVVLTSQPLHGVNVNIIPLRNAGYSIAPEKLSFQAEDWDKPQNLVLSKELEREKDLLSTLLVGLCAAIGYWITLSLNIADFTEDAVSKKSHIWGQLVGIQVGMLVVGFVAVIIFGQQAIVGPFLLEKPSELAIQLQQNGNLFFVVFCLVLVIVAGLSTNIPANFVASVTCFEALFRDSSKRNFETSSVVFVGVSGLFVTIAFELLHKGDYYKDFLIGFAWILAPFSLILAVDQFFIKNGHINDAEVGHKNGEYAYFRGWNIAATTLALGGSVVIGFVSGAIENKALVVLLNLIVSISVTVLYLTKRNRDKFDTQSKQLDTSIQLLRDSGADQTFEKKIEAVLNLYSGQQGKFGCLLVDTSNMKGRQKCSGWEVSLKKIAGFFSLFAPNSYGYTSVWEPGSKVNLKELHSKLVNSGEFGLAKTTLEILRQSANVKHEAPESVAWVNHEGILAILVSRGFEFSIRDISSVVSVLDASTSIAAQLALVEKTYGIDSKLFHDWKQSLLLGQTVTSKSIESVDANSEWIAEHVMGRFLGVFPSLDAIIEKDGSIASLRLSESEQLRKLSSKTTANEVFGVLSNELGWNYSENKGHSTVVGHLQTQFEHLRSSEVPILAQEIDSELIPGDHQESGYYFTFSSCSSSARCACVSIDDLREILASKSSQLLFLRLLTRQLPKSKLSPYQPSKALRSDQAFYGRVGVREKLNSILGKPGNSIALVGRSTAGKTSLLYWLQRNLNGKIVAYVDLTTASDESSVVQTLVEEICSTAIGRRTSKRLLKSKPDVTTFAELADFLVREGEDLNNHVWMFDEVDSFINRGESVWNCLSSLKAISNNKGLRTILSGRSVLFDECQLKVRSLGNYSEVIKLGPLEDTACFDLIQQPLAGLGVRIEKPMAKSIVQRTFGWPRIIQEICQDLIDEFDDSKSLPDEIVSDVLDAIVAKRLPELRGQISNELHVSELPEVEWLSLLLCTFMAERQTIDQILDTIKRLDLPVPGHDVMQRALGKLQLVGLVEKRDDKIIADTKAITWLTEARERQITNEYQRCFT